MKKLPYKLRDQWEKFRHRATFGDIVEFVERQVKITSDPQFGDILASPGTGRKETKIEKSRTSLKPRGSGFVTSTC